MSRPAVLNDVERLLETAHRLDGHAGDDDRRDALELLAHRCRVAPDHARRDLLITLAADALLWAEQIDQAEIMRVDLGDAA